MQIPPQLGPLCDLAGQIKFHFTIPSLCYCLHAVNVIVQATQLITRHRIAEPHQLDNLPLIGRILIDYRFQELAELLVELLVNIFPLDSVCNL